MTILNCRINANPSKLKRLRVRIFELLRWAPLTRRRHCQHSICTTSSMFLLWVIENNSQLEPSTPTWSSIFIVTILRPCHVNGPCIVPNIVLVASPVQFVSFGSFAVPRFYLHVILAASELSHKYGAGALINLRTMWLTVRGRMF